MDQDTQAALATVEAWLREMRAFTVAVERYCMEYGEGERLRRLEELTQEMAQSLEVIVAVLAEEVRDRAARC